MKVQLRRYAAGAVAAGAIAAVAAFALPAGTPDWAPVTYGLTESADQLLPATVSEAKPARVVSTKLDRHGRPVVTVKQATDKASAVKLVEDAQSADGAIGVELDAKTYAYGAPTGTDLYRGKQWGLATMHVADAWQKSTGAGVTVAVIDTGVDATNVDLAGQVLTGYDATTDKVGGNIDPHGHGTHVAGTIAAVTGNTIGVSGVAPDAKILPVRVLGNDGSGYMSDAAEGILWAADNGAQVINMSLGSSEKVAAVTTAITYARSKGVTVIAAAGNERKEGSPVSYPAAEAGVIAVAATDSADQVAEYSNAGSFVDVAAPGSAILSTYPSALGKSYSTMSGTSMASPHVAAVAALLKAAKPSLTPDQIEQALETSAVDLGPSGKDNDFGYGRIDALAALATVGTPTSAPTTAPAKPTAPAPTAPTTAPTTKAPTTAPTTKAPTTAPTKAPTSAPTTAPTSKAPTAAPTSAAPSPSTSSATKVTPVIVADTTAADVAYNGSTVTTFTVTAGGQAWTRKNAKLCIAETGKSFQCVDVVTSAAGVISLDRVATAGYQLQLRVAATDVNEAATATATYTVHSTASAFRSGNRTMGVELASPAGLTVQVQQQVRGTWKTVFSFVTKKTATQVTIGGLAPGQQYRVLVPGTAAVAGATSGIVAG
ncbi:S8 family peptidase [Actinoplanes awajinensis]|uniref:Peptidase n=1 Tax=Actinoplanes awajinensis subsp. mycoplanecinus TaxID=135947 RepID=A0A101JTC2_9ACTN|nr:S8 family peptidase [Actinoplanes awajinensis]KUL32656.1 peptidase [Actinoplanes awajinensis subsp. mycoplanecinus]